MCIIMYKLRTYHPTGTQYTPCVFAAVKLNNFQTGSKTKMGSIFKQPEAITASSHSVWQKFFGQQEFEHISVFR